MGGFSTSAEEFFLPRFTRKTQRTPPSLNPSVACLLLLCMHDLPVLDSYSYDMLRETFFASRLSSGEVLTTFASRFDPPLAHTFVAEYSAVPAPACM